MNFVKIGNVYYNLETLYSFEEAPNGLSVTSASGTHFHPGLTEEDAIEALLLANATVEVLP